MRRVTAALALAAVLSPLETAMAESCAPRAEVAGETAVVERVTAELRRLGVTIAPAIRSCPSVYALVETDRDGGVAVAVRGAGQRSEGRVVSDPELAAAWIDAWVRDDLDVAGWALASEAPAAMVTAPRDVRPTPPAAPTTAPSRPWSMSALYERAWAGEGSWMGGSIAACVHVGGMCVGGRVRAAFQSDLVVNLTAADRRDLSALVTASVPVSVGNTVIAPELGLGLGQLALRRVESCQPTEPPPNCEPMDPTCVAPPVACTDPNGTSPGAVYVGDGLSATSYTPRLAFAVRIAVPLFSMVWLDGIASYTLAPLGHREAYATTTMDTMVPADQVALPGDPSAGLQLGVGLRVGVP